MNAGAALSGLRPSPVYTSPPDRTAVRRRRIVQHARDARSVATQANSIPYPLQGTVVRQFDLRYTAATL
jgi:hypothetical protein